ncbi:MAG TPA: hypothetical protein VFH47_03105, partial [Candidatus Thermoplasmatota archaeon]|nr:hypothetical protein [Candidatus Thermoplasmatota archaeon]
MVSLVLPVTDTAPEPHATDQWSSASPASPASAAVAAFGIWYLQGMVMEATPASGSSGKPSRSGSPSVSRGRPPCATAAGESRRSKPSAAASLWSMP